MLNEFRQIIELPYFSLNYKTSPFCKQPFSIFQAEQTVIKLHLQGTDLRQNGKLILIAPLPKSATLAQDVAY